MTGWVLYITGFLAGIFALWRMARRLRFCLHILQLEGYRTGAYASWVAARPFDLVFRLSHLLGVLIVAAGALGLTGSTPVASSVLFLGWAIAFASSRRYRRDRPKKPLVWTSRMRRLAVVASLFPLAAVAAGLAASLDAGPTFLAWPLLVGFGLADLGAPLWAGLAGLLLQPVERRFHEGFKSLARARLADRPDLTIVAITGSYGKTSVKFAVNEALAQRYHVLATPGSFNTPMGICRVINNRLKAEHQVLVLEMGIRHPGDIAELCDIARPDIAVVTGVGVAHLESMGSVEAIAREKGSLLDYLPAGGTAVLNMDDPWYENLRQRAPGPVLSISAEGDTRSDLRASGVTFGPAGTRFAVTDEADRSVDVAIRLLGRHNVSNTLLALGVARALHIRLRQAARGIAALEPVPHRLELRNEGGLLILDDAFNSNPAGAEYALEVLGQFPGRRLVVTPGMIELGEREVLENEAFGSAMAGRVDDVILVGPARTEPIARGLAAADFPLENVHIVHTLWEARETVRRLAGPGDVVLYENDLPDQFTEART